MTKQFIVAACMGAALIFSQTSCKKKGEFKKKGSIEYAIITDKDGKNAVQGDIVEFQITFKVGDSLLGGSWKDNGGKPVQVRVDTAGANPLEWINVLTMFSVGDSGVIRLTADTIKKYNGGNLPPFMKDGQTAYYEISIVAIKSLQQVQQEEAAKAAKQKDVDDKILQDYFAKNNIQPSKTAKGVYYVTEKEGTGAGPNSGDQVSVKYTGKTLDGTTFDSNVDSTFHHTQPFTFMVGMGQVIPGWDDGVMVMKKGGKAKLFIPSPLAYGAQAPGPGIPANAILTFDVEVLDIKPAPAQPANANQSPMPVQ